MEDKEKLLKEIKKGNRYKLWGVIFFVLGFLLLIFLPYYHSINSTILKPVIYVYPKETTIVSVALDKENNITCSYPKYDGPWIVSADPNGNLVDLETGRNLYSLYYEADNETSYKVQKDGFVVKGENTAEFLEEKLRILGLTDKEAEEFIIYWLPILEANKYNYIRFAESNEIESNMGLDINPKPDTLIRIVMTYKPLNNPITVEEQTLKKGLREGYTVVEWGGSEIK